MLTLLTMLTFNIVYMKVIITISIAEMEVFIQSNSKLPELSTDRWKYPSHKVNQPPKQ